MNTDRRIRLTKKEWLFVLICFLLYLFWAGFFIDQYDYYGPDEIMRYQVSEYIVQHHKLPNGWEKELISDAWGFSYALDLKLPYLISAVFMAVTKFFTDSADAMIMASRFCSILSGTGIALLSVIISKRCFGKSPFRWLFAFLMSFLPQIVFLTSYFNLDVFSLFTVMLIVNAWLKCTEENFSVRSCAFLAIGLGLCLISYSFAYGYLVGSLLLYVLWYASNREKVTFKTFICRGCLILLIVFAISGWMLIRNGILYDGDIFAVKNRAESAELYAIDELKPSKIDTFRNAGKTAWDMLLHTDFVELSYRSFICVLGPMAIRGSLVMYFFYAALMASGIIGLIKKKNGMDKRFLICGILSCMITLGLSVYYSWAVDYEPQGRYIITIAPILFLTVTEGIKNLAEGRKNGKTIAFVLCVCVAMTCAEAFVDCLAFYSSNFNGLLLF